MEKTGTTALVDDDGNAVMDSRGRTRMTDVVTAVDAIRVPRPVLRVCQTLIWRDLAEALDCVTTNLTNFRFWQSIRMISLTFVDDHLHGTNFDVAGNHRGKFLYPKAHWVFLHLADIFRELHFERGGHQLWTILVKIHNWNAIKSMDTAGMFGLSLIPALPAVKFLPAVDRHSLNRYMAAPVRLSGDFLALLPTVKRLFAAFPGYSVITALQLPFIQTKALILIAVNLKDF